MAGRLAGGGADDRGAPDGDCHSRRDPVVVHDRSRAHAAAEDVATGLRIPEHDLEYLVRFDGRVAEYGHGDRLADAGLSGERAGFEREGARFRLVIDTG